MRLIEKVWFKGDNAKWFILPVLLPLSLLFLLLSSTRRFLYRINVLKSTKVSVPVVIVGNIGIGGNGKTPVVLYLVEQCKKLGLHAGVVSRGYGGKAPSYPYLLSNLSTASEAGDEPILIYKRSGINVAVGANRVAAAQRLIAQGCNVIIADDGLQHYQLERDVECIVVDNKRKFGNGFLLPAGPLREGKWRLNKVDFVIYNTAKPASSVAVFDNKRIEMTLFPNFICNIKTSQKIPLLQFLKNHSKVNAIAGIGDPSRFFTMLREQQFELDMTKGFVDHHPYCSQDFNDFSDEKPLLMTEKDAVKCQNFAKNNFWYVPVDAKFSDVAAQAILNKLSSIVQNKTD